MNGIDAQPIRAYTYVPYALDLELRPKNRSIPKYPRSPLEYTRWLAILSSDESVQQNIFDIPSPIHDR
jgi:hypothetical protein